MKPTCETCRFFVVVGNGVVPQWEYSERVSHGDIVYECHRHAPALTLVTHNPKLPISAPGSVGVWPSPSRGKDDWCGEHENKA